MGISALVREGLFRSFYQATGRRGFLRAVEATDALHHAPPATRRALAGESLRRILVHATTTVPYYRRVVGAPANGAVGLDAFSWLSRFPVLTKEVIRREGQTLLSERPGEKLRWNTSGGSTGEPVRLLQDRSMNYQMIANKLLYMRWLGYRYGDSHLLIWGVPEETFGERIDLRERIYRVIHHQRYMNCYEISDAIMGRWVDVIRRDKPAVIEAYADALYQLSRMMLASHLAVTPPKGIIVSAGVLRPDMRESIAAAFNCPVLNRYGSREVGDIACSCPGRTELHISENLCVIEVVDEDGAPCPPGVEGDILVTLFSNFAMPLIRYRIEDRGVFARGACSCGRSSARLAAIAGRRSDYLVAADGTKINGTALTTLLYPVRDVVAYQYRQREADRVTLALVPRSLEAREAIARDLRGPLGQLRGLLKGVVVEYEFVEGISPSKSGKHRYVLNEVADVERRPECPAC